MLLQTYGLVNDISAELRKKLEEKVKSFGKKVRYKFDIGNVNPDPDKVNGTTLWPNNYTLDPTVFNIVDPYEKREGKSKSKRIGMVDPDAGTDERGNPKRYKKIKVSGREKGIFELLLEEIPEHFDMAMFMELHPKLVGGEFQDKTKHAMITRIDEKALATKEKTDRTARKNAMDAAEAMSDKDVVNFCDAIGFDSTEDILVLRNKVEEHAEKFPQDFTDLIKDGKVGYQSLVKQALDKGVIIFDPAENSMSWGSNKQKITVMGKVDGKTHVQQFAEFLTIGGDNAQQVHKKIKSLVSGKEVPA